MADGPELLQAIAQGDVARVADLVAEDPAVATARDAQGVSALMLAQYHRRDDLAQMLVDTGLAPDVFEASALGRVDDVERQLDRDPALARAWSPDGFTALHLACFFGGPAVARLLLERGAEVNVAARNAMEVLPLHSAAAADATEIVTVLLEAGADPDARQAGGYTALHAAAQHDAVEMARALLDHGADPGVRADDGRTPADLARERAATAVLGLLEGPG